MAWENGDIAYGSSGAPYVGYTTGFARVLKSLSDAAQTSCTAAAISADGSKVAFGHSSGSAIDVYDTATWTRTAVSWSGGQVNDLEFSPDGSMLAVAHSTPSPYLTIYNTSTWTAISDGGIAVTSTAWGVSFSPDGSRLAIAHNGSPYLTVLNTADWTTRAAPATAPSGNCLCVDYSADGQRLAVTSSTAPRIFIYDVSDMSSLSAPTISSGNPNSVEWSPDRSMLAVGMAVSTFLRVFNASDWSSVSGTPTIGSQVNEVAWATNNELVICNTSFPRLAVWDRAAGVLTELSGAAGTVQTVAVKRYTPTTISGTVLDTNSAGVGRTIRAYRRDTGELVGSTVSNSTTGAYSLSCRYSSEHDVVLLDDTLGTVENDQVLRTTPV